jgi:NTP pyrophosphatase (non-canonical NTP hydrolase)
VTGPFPLDSPPILPGSTVRWDNTTDLPLEFALAHAELSEAFEASRKDPDHFGEELADTLIFLVAIAEMRGVDLDAAVDAKLTKNAARTYRRAANGVLVKTDETATAEKLARGSART